MSASDYLPIKILILVVTGLALVILLLSHWSLINPRRFGRRKHATYESGMEPFGDTRRRFNVRFYLIAVLFLVFDVELLFMWPWATLLPRLSNPADPAQAATRDALVAAGVSVPYLLGAVAIFFGLLLVGFVYEWRKGIFKWN